MSLPKRLFLCAALVSVPLLAQTLDTQQSAFLTLINNYRAQNGVGPLQVSVTLQNSSQWMSGDMASKNYFSHTDSLGRAPNVRMGAFAYPIASASWGENIAAGYSDAQSTFNQWQNACDPDGSGNCTYAHRLNMLNGAFRVMGIGRAYSSTSAYGWYWTTDFGSVVDSVLGSTPPAPVINSFTASPSTVSAGQSATLSWSVTGTGITLSLDNGIGDVSTLTSKSVTPGATTTYTLVASNSGGTVSSRVTITVNATSPPPFTAIRVNSGGPAYTDPQGNVWSADTGTTSSYTWTSNGSVANTTTPALYQTCRYGAAFGYQFAVPNGAYTVKLKFAEPSMSGANQRLFNASIDGTAVLANFDIFASAGGAMIAVDRSFPVNVSGGQISIQFTAGSANYPMVNAIEIVQGTAASGAVRVNAGGGSLADASGSTWAADSYFSGGQTWNTSSNITNTATPALYQTCRYGSSFSYQFPAASGSYNVTLKFAEISRFGPGQRVFNVAINGVPVLTNFDIYAHAGGALIALDEVFPVTVTGGTITVQFTSGSSDYPMVNAISVAQGNAPVRIHAGGGAVTDASGNVWSADASYIGGSTWSTTQNIANTSSAALYQTCRYGNGFSYQFNVTNGSYNVLLKFAEISRTAPGQRIFGVAINGVAVLSNFDIVAAAGGPLIAIDKTFPVNVTNGQIQVQFLTGPADLPLINAIQIQ